MIFLASMTRDNKFNVIIMFRCETVCFDEKRSMGTYISVFDGYYASTTYLCMRFFVLALGFRKLDKYWTNYFVWYFAILNNITYDIFQLSLSRAGIKLRCRITKYWSLFSMSLVLLVLAEFVATNSILNAVYSLLQILN